MVRYDEIGHGYAANRHEDPDLRDRLDRALGPGRLLLNVGAGTGSYESVRPDVVAVEPSRVMLAQRPATAGSAVQATAAPLPFPTDAVDAAMAVVTIHHWDDQLAAGVAELCRVARGPVAIVTFDIDVCLDMWLVTDYFPEIAELDRATMPPIADLVALLEAHDRAVEVEVVPTRADTPDWTLASFWAHPERVLDETARRSTSGFSRMPTEVVDRVVAAVAADLADGTWDARHGHLRDLDAYDVGMRLLVALPIWAK